MRFFRFKKLVSMETSKYLRYAVGDNTCSHWNSNSITD